jgi:hypothetical protein
VHLTQDPDDEERAAVRRRQRAEHERKLKEHQAKVCGLPILTPLLVSVSNVLRAQVELLHKWRQEKATREKAKQEHRERELEAKRK